jgi:hypothetical protein
MTFKYYSRIEVVERLGVDADFLMTLERESIVTADAPSNTTGEFSARMFERIRVAHNLVHDLEVNLAGAGIIVRMREDLLGRRKDLEQVLLELRRRAGEDAADA